MDFMTEDEVAVILQVSPRTVEGWRRRKIGPPYYIVADSLIRYPDDEFDRWLDERDAYALGYTS